MCAGTVELAAIEGSGKGAQGWFPLRRAQAVYDHPYHAQMGDALILDFTNPERGPGARISVELSAVSARSLVRLIEDALEAGERQHAVADSRLTESIASLDL